MYIWNFYIALHKKCLEFWALKTFKELHISIKDSDNYSYSVNPTLGLFYVFNFF